MFNSFTILPIGCISMSANIFVGAKHFGSKSLVLTNKLSAEMLRPRQNEMLQSILLNNQLFCIQF